MKTGDPIRIGSRNAHSRAIAGNFITNLAGLPERKGRRPITVRGPLHVQCGDNTNHTLLRELVEDVTAWPGIEAIPSPVGTEKVVSLRADEGLAGDDTYKLIDGREFARVLFGAPTIYLALPLSCAHRVVVKKWAEPHYSGSFGLMPPGVMVVYTPRDEGELKVCRSLFLVSYIFALTASSSDSTAERDMLRSSSNRSPKFVEAVAA